MIGPRAIAGLSLLCALAFCAFAAPGASAKGTTAYTCEPAPKGTEVGFSDEHCDNAVITKATWVHKAIEVGKETKITSSNKFTKNNTTEHTTGVIHSTAFGIKVTITCTNAHMQGTLTNTEEGGVMHSGGAGAAKYTECTVSEPAKCQVKEPIVAEAKAKSWENGEEMGVEFTPKNGKTFVEITLENKGAEKCAVKGTFPIGGSVIGTPGGTSAGKGATLWFGENEAGKTAMQKLTFGGQPASVTVVTTAEMEEATPTTGNAISGTTS